MRKESQKPDVAFKSMFDVDISFDWILFDLGNANARMWCNGLAQPISWRSVQGHTGHKTRYTKLPKDWAIKWRDMAYVFGDRAYAEVPDTLDDWPTTDRYVSDWYKRMFAFGLYRASLYRDNPDEPYEPIVVLSVPAKEYSNPTRLNDIQERLIGVYRIETVNGDIVEVDITDNNINLVPEGLGSFLYTSAQYPDHELDKGLWVVIDLGYLTGDYVEFRNGIYVPDSPDSNDKLGMNYVSQRVADYIHGMGGPSLTAAYVDPMVNEQCIIVSNEPYQVNDEYHSAMGELGTRVSDWVRRKAANKDVKGVLLTGGNVANQAQSIALHKLPRPILCPDGEMGNLLGAHLMLQGLE